MKIREDKIRHLVVSFMISSFVAMIVAIFGGSVIVSCISGFLCSIFCGIGKEYGDSCAENNQWSWSDIAADFVGALFGSLFGFISLLI